MKILKNAGVDMLMGYLNKDPVNNIPKMLNLAEKLDAGNLHTSQIAVMRNTIGNPDSVWHQFVVKLFEEVELKYIKKLVKSFFINSNLMGSSKLEESRKKYDCNVPWAILMDPTSACNLKCTGCWAAEYGDKHNLSFETLDSIINQGKELGIYFYIYSGGEPTIRKKDIIKLAEKHQECYFMAFTNGTLVDDAFCEELARVGNFALAFSIEGDESATDMRRGGGTYQHVVEAMERMRKRKLIFGYSTCYHRNNTESVGSDEFVDDMVARGCRFAWNFTYMPVGQSASPDLLATAEQRAWMYKRIHEIRATKPIFAMDFWNDGEYAGGCIAGGRRYLHINAAGDVEPCAFAHFANVNIHTSTLLEALQSPVFQAYRKRQPFNANPLQPCPVLDNPDAIEEIIRESKAESTDMMAPDPVEDLTARTREQAAEWAVKATEVWAANPKSKKVSKNA